MAWLVHVLLLLLKKVSNSFLTLVSFVVIPFTPWLNLNIYTSCLLNYHWEQILGAAADL